MFASGFLHSKGVVNTFAGLEFKVDLELVVAVFDTREGGRGLGKHHVKSGLAVVEALEISTPRDGHLAGGSAGGSGQGE